MLGAGFSQEYPIAVSNPPGGNPRQAFGTNTLRMGEDCFFLHHYLPLVSSKPYSMSNAFTFS